MVVTKESAQTVEKEEETQTEVTLEELDTTSKSEVETSGEESTEEETESEEEPKEKEPEESIEDKVTRLAQSMKDKELKSVYKEMEGYKTKVGELESQLNDKIWDRELQTLFNEDVENLGEDEAKTRKANREKVAEQVREYRLKSAEVEKAKKQLEEQMPKLGIIERTQKARGDLWGLLFPEDKEKVAQLNKLITKFDKAQDWDDYEIIFEGIKATVKGKENSFVPDSSKSSGGGITDWTKLDRDTKDKLAAEALRKEKRGK